MLRFGPQHSTLFATGRAEGDVASDRNIARLSVVDFKLKGLFQHWNLVMRWRI